MPAPDDPDERRTYNGFNGIDAPKTDHADEKPVLLCQRVIQVCHELTDKSRDHKTGGLFLLTQSLLILK